MTHLDKINRDLNAITKDAEKPDPVEVAMEMMAALGVLQVQAMAMIADEIANLGTHLQEMAANSRGERL